MKRPVVFADTNVLYPYYLSDLLLFLSSDGVIRLLWTQYLVDEVVEVVPRRFLRGKGGRSSSDVQRQWDAATKYLASDEVSEANWQACRDLVSGPDPDDLPHMAAAIAGSANFLLTADRRGFSRSQLQQHGVRLCRADQFLCELLEADTESVVLTLRSRATSFARPPMTLEEYLDTLSRTVPRFAQQAAVATLGGLSLAARARWFTRRARVTAARWARRG